MIPPPGRHSQRSTAAIFTIDPSGKPQRRFPLVGITTIRMLE